MYLRPDARNEWRQVHDEIKQFRGLIAARLQYSSDEEHLLPNLFDWHMYNITEIMKQHLIKIGRRVQWQNADEIMYDSPAKITDEELNELNDKLGKMYNNWVVVKSVPPVSVTQTFAPTTSAGKSAERAAQRVRSSVGRSSTSLSCQSESRITLVIMSIVLGMLVATFWICACIFIRQHSNIAKSQSKVTTTV